MQILPLIILTSAIASSHPVEPLPLKIRGDHVRQVEDQRIGIIHRYEQTEKFTEVAPGGLMVIDQADRDKLTFAGIDPARTNIGDSDQNIECRVEDLDRSKIFGTFGLQGVRGVLFQDVTKVGSPATITCEFTQKK